MLEAASKVVRYTAAVDRASFFADEQLYDATVHNLYVLGEASKGIPERIRTAHPEIDWRRIAGLRDVLAHAYFAVNETTIWEIIREKVPSLATQLRGARRIEVACGCSVGGQIQPCVAECIGTSAIECSQTMHLIRGREQTVCRERKHSDLEWIEQPRECATDAHVSDLRRRIQHLVLSA